MLGSFDMNNFKKFKSGAGQATESNDGASEALADMFGNPINQNEGLLEELEKSRGLVKDLSEKLNKTVSELNLEELTVSKAELEERLRFSTYLVEELQLFNERLESEKSKLTSKSTLAQESGLVSRSTGLETSGSDVMDSEAGEAMERNHEAREPFPNIFGIPVILRLILEQLPNSNLLKLSLVSKSWKKEARSVMKKRGDVMALLECDGLTGCGQVFRDFAAHSESLNEPLYSGMTIRLRSDYACEGTMGLEVEAIHESIVNGMRGKLTRLSIELFGVQNCWSTGVCPNFLLLRLLLRDFIGDLEHLTLVIVDIMAPFIHQYLTPTPGPYPKLKVLKLYATSDEETLGNQIRMLVSQAPNLLKIHTDGSMSLRENLLEGREGALHVHESYVHNPMRDISENVIPALRLERINFFYTPEAELNLDRWNEKAQNLLRTCCANTLKSLYLDSPSGVVLFMSYGIRLLNVKDLTIDFHDHVKFEKLDPQIKSIMTRFDFTYYLPKLESVDIRYSGCFPELSPNEMTAISEQANNAVRRVPTLPRNGNIKSLDLQLSFIPEAAVEFFSKVFPAIKRLHVYMSKQQYKCKAFPVKSAWDHWPDLKSITERYGHEGDEMMHERP